MTTAVFPKGSAGLAEGEGWQDVGKFSLEPFQRPTSTTPRSIADVTGGGSAASASPEHDGRHRPSIPYMTLETTNAATAMDSAVPKLPLEPQVGHLQGGVHSPAVPFFPKVDQTEDWEVVSESEHS